MSLKMLILCDKFAASLRFSVNGGKRCSQGTPHALSKQHDMCWKLDWLQLGWL